MCGISAILRFKGEAGGDLRDLAVMHAAVRHRGPDAEGVYLVDARHDGSRLESLDAIPVGGTHRVAVAVRRLRVSDLRTEADQPLVSKDGRTCAMLNGAIYNYRELAEELRAAGCTLATSSDAEVLLEAYRHWGTGCFARFDGMWAALIVDLARGVVVGSRDRFGIKPLYFAREEGRLSFCSEPAALARILRGGPRPEPARLFEFLSGYPPRSSALSFFRGVHPVAPGTWFEVKLQSEATPTPEFVPYWRLADHHWDGHAPALSFAEAAERYRELLARAVASQSRADAHVGSLLSGGLDTSAIVSFWAREARERGSGAPETFSITWDVPGMSEDEFQQAVLQATGARGHELRLTPADVWRAADRVVAAQGQPLLGQELIAQYLVYAFARERGAVVMLDGSGSDEVQAGLPPYEAEMVVERLERFELWDVARELHCIARSYGRSHVNVMRQYLVGPLRRNRAERAGLPRHEWLDERACDTSDPAWAAASARDASADPSRVNRLLYRETRHTNVPAVLMYSDRNAMAHSIEARFPFLDHRLVEFCFSLPASYKVGFGRRKKLLREAAEGVVDRRVLERRDKKMFVKLDNWMPLRDHGPALREAARNVSLSGAPGVDAARMHRFVDDYVAGRHDEAYAVWRIFTASRWFDLHGM
jgi:asparagine synthase (glutamine-hydrolysing)